MNEDHFWQEMRSDDRQMHILIDEDEIAELDVGQTGILADYNADRPHSALGYQTPAAFAAQLTAMGDWLHEMETFRRSPIAPVAQSRQIQPRTPASAG